MLINFTTCPITGTIKMENEIFDVPGNPFLMKYKNQIIGEVIIPTQLFTMLEGGKYSDIFPIITGILRENYERYGKPFDLNDTFLSGGYKEYNYPNDFNEKAKFFLKYLFDSGGKEYKSIKIFPRLDYSLAHANGIDEFYRILKKLELEDYIGMKKYETEDGEIVQAEILLTQKGLKEF